MTTSCLAFEKPELDVRLRKLMMKFDSLQSKPDKRIPPDKLQQAQAVVLLDRTKAGFIFAYQGGSGVAMVKGKGQTWSPAAFYKADEASLGFQVGGQKTFMVILFMNTNAARLLTEPNVNFGGEASGTAGEDSARAEGNISPTEQGVLVFDDRRGLYGGAALKGGAIVPDTEANIVYYGQAVSPGEILFERKVKSSEAMTELAKKITQASTVSGK